MERSVPVCHSGGRTCVSACCEWPLCRCCGQHSHHRGLRSREEVPIRCICAPAPHRDCQPQPQGCFENTRIERSYFLATRYRAFFQVFLIEFDTINAGRNRDLPGSSHPWPEHKHKHKPRGSAGSGSDSHRQTHSPARAEPQSAHLSSAKAVVPRTLCFTGTRFHNL